MPVQDNINPYFRSSASSLLSCPTTSTPSCLVLAQELPAAGHFLTAQRRLTGRCALWRCLVVMSTASVELERSGLNSSLETAMGSPMELPCLILFYRWRMLWEAKLVMVWGAETGLDRSNVGSVDSGPGVTDTLLCRVFECLV
jgi:hypothetical protein